MNISRIVFLVILTVSITCSGQSDDDQIKGKVKSVREKVTDFREGKNQMYMDATIEGGYLKGSFENDFWTNSDAGKVWFNSISANYRNSFKIYRVDGKIQHEEFYFNNQNLVIANTYTYNERGDLISRSTSKSRYLSATDYGFERSFTNYVYDENNNIIKERTSFEGQKFIEITRLYNSNNLLCYESEIDSSNPDGIRKTYYWYDDSNNQTAIGRGYGEGDRLRIHLDEYTKGLKTATYFSFNINKYVDLDSLKKLNPRKNEKNSIYEYDKNENLVKEIGNYLNNGKGDIAGSFVSEYQYENNLLVSEITTFSNSESFEKKTFEYDNQGNLKRSFYKDCAGSGVVTHPCYELELIYDRKNEKITSLYHYELDGNGKESTHKIKFDEEIDSKGNWIKRVKWVNGEHFATWTREIEYYD